MLDVQTKASAYQNNQTSCEYRQRLSPGQIRVFEKGLRNCLENESQSSTEVERGTNVFCTFKLFLLLLHFLKKGLIV